MSDLQIVLRQSEHGSIRERINALYLDLIHTHPHDPNGPDAAELYDTAEYYVRRQIVIENLAVRMYRSQRRHVRYNRWPKSHNRTLR